MKTPMATIEDFATNLQKAESGFIPNAVTVRVLRDALLAMGQDTIGIGSVMAKAAEMAAAYLTEFGDPEMALEVGTEARITGRPLSSHHYSNRKNIDFNESMNASAGMTSTKRCRENCGFEAAPMQNGLCFVCSGVTKV